MVVDYVKIDDERRFKKYSQPVFAQKIGLSLQGYLRMMKKETITANQLLKICEVLNKDVYYFIQSEQKTIQVNEPTPPGYSKNTSVKDKLEAIRRLVDEIDKTL